MSDPRPDLEQRLAAVDARVREAAVAEIGEQISTSGEHGFDGDVFRALATSVVDALLVEPDDGAFEAELSALVELAEWELVAADDIDRALVAEARPRRPGLDEHWRYLRECRSLYPS